MNGRELREQLEARGRDIPPETPPMAWPGYDDEHEGQGDEGQDDDDPEGMNHGDEEAE